MPVPGLFVFSAGDYKTSMTLRAILTGLSFGVGLALAGYAIGRLVQWHDRVGQGRNGLLPRIGTAFTELDRRRQRPGEISAENASRLLALFTDLKTYVDQRSDAYAWRVLGQIETDLNLASPTPRR